MSTTYSSSLVVGISLQEFFRKVEKKTETFDEYDKKGNKTGKTFKETKLIATLPDGNDVVIGDVNFRYGDEYFNYDFYSSLSFDDSESDQTFLQLHKPYYEANDLDDHIIGIQIISTEWVEKIEINTLYETLRMVQKELSEKFQYIGNVYIYTLRNVS